MRSFTTSFIGLAACVAFSACTNASNAVSPPAPLVPNAQIETVNAASSDATITFFQSSFVFGGKTFTYKMVGSDPFTDPKSIKIPTEIIPVELRFANGATFDPATAVHSIEQSPIFKPGIYTAGTLQFGDALMRSEFRNVIRGSKAYDVILGTPTVERMAILNIPDSAGFVGTSSGVRTAFLHSQYFLDPNGIEQQLLSTYRISPRSLAIFAVTDMRVLEEGGNCCYNGYHTSYTVPTTAGTSTFTTVWGNVSAAAPLNLSHVSHEVAEWLDDPFYSPPAEFVPPRIPQYNHAPVWVHPVTKACVNDELEVGDPLVGVHITVNGFMVQDVAFLSWFTRTPSSYGIDGRYDLLGRLHRQTRTCS